MRRYGRGWQARRHRVPVRATDVRILHVGKFFPPAAGGMETFLHDLALQQRAAGHDVEVLVHGVPLVTDPAWLTRVPVQFHVAFAPVALGFRAALVAAVRRVQPDIVHWHLPNTSAFWGLTHRELTQVPWVLHWHSDVLVDRMPLWVRLCALPYRLLEQGLLDRAARIVVTSPPYLQASATLARWQDKCAVVPLGIPAPVNAEQAARCFDSPWTDDRLRVLSIGRLTYYKGFGNLIDMLASRDDIDWIIAGDGELLALLQAQVARLRARGQPCRVTLLGHVDDARKWQLLSECDLFCLPSIERTEAFGVTVLEAMATGKPCLVSQLAGSGLPWLVRESGAGLTVAPQDAAGWHAALDTLHDRQRRAAWGEAARRALNARFTIASCARGVAAVYAQACDAPAPARIAAASTDDLAGHGLIVIPAKNEAPTIGGLVRRLHAAGHARVLVVDDHSSDGTGDIARQAGAMVVRPVLPVGAWGAMQTGMRWGLRQGFAWAVTMDADDQHDVDEVQTLIAARHSAQVVIGAFPERASRLRRIAWAWFRWLGDFELRDLTSGFRLYSRDAMRLVCSDRATLLDYQDLGALLMIRRAGLSICEVPVVMNARRNGISRIFHSWGSVTRYMLVTTLLCLTLPRARPGSASPYHPEP